MHERFGKATTVPVSAFLLSAVCMAASSLQAFAWEVDLNPQRWSPPETKSKHDLANTTSGLKFSLLDNPTRVRNILSWTYATGGSKLENYNYCLITYRAEGLSRGLDPSRKYVVVTINTWAKQLFASARKAPANKLHAYPDRHGPTRAEISLA